MATERVTTVTNTPVATPVATVPTAPAAAVPGAPVAAVPVATPVQTTTVTTERVEERSDLPSIGELASGDPTDSV